MMKMIMKLLGVKYMVTRAKAKGGTRYFWRLSSAIADVQKKDYLNRQVVWTLDYHKAYVQEGAWSHVHPDANNYNTSI